MNRRGGPIGREAKNEAHRQRYHKNDDAGQYDEYEELEAEGEATIQYQTPKVTYRRMSFKARRTRASIHQGSQDSKGFEPEAGDHGDVGPQSQRSKSDTLRSWIPRGGQSKMGSVSSVSLEVELEDRKSSNSASNLALVPSRKHIGSYSNQPKKTVSSVQQRLNSAKEIQIKDLTSKVHHLETIIQNLTAENKTLKTGFSRQAAALQKYEGEEADLPKVLNFHKSEVKYLQQSLRSAQQSCRKYEDMIRGLNKKILGLEDQNRKLKNLVDSNDLEEREKLQRRLIDTIRQLGEAQQTIEEHGRQFELLQKNHVHQLGTIQAKLKASDNRVYSAEQELYRLTDLIQQKDRVISYLRMRSRDRGLEPPLHRKVMEQFNSDYKYYYQVEQSADSEVFTDTHVQTGDENYECRRKSKSTTELFHGTKTEKCPEKEIDRKEKRAIHHSKTFENRDDIERPQSPGSTPATIPTGEYCSSPKSMDSQFSEEMRQHSRERNLDQPCPYSEEEAEPDAQPESDNEKNIPRDVDQDDDYDSEAEFFGTVRPMQHPSNIPKRGATYVLYRQGDSYDQRIDNGFYVMDVEPLAYDNNEERDQHSDQDSSSRGNVQDEDSPLRSIDYRTSIPSEPTYERLLGTGDTETDAGQEIHTQTEDQDGTESREYADTGTAQGEYDDHRQHDGDSDSDDDIQLAKYSEEEFYGDSSVENEVIESGIEGLSFYISQSPKASSNVPHIPPEDKQYFAYLSKPRCVKATGDQLEHGSDQLSPHDLIFYRSTPRNSSAEEVEDQEELATNDDGFYRNSSCLSNASNSTANSHSSIALLHAIRPKGPTKQSPANSREYTAESREVPPVSTEGEPRSAEDQPIGNWYMDDSNTHITTTNVLESKIEKPDRTQLRHVAKQPITGSVKKQQVPVNPRPIVKKPLPKQLPSKPTNSKRFI